MKEEIGVENFDRYKETLFLNNWKDAVGRAGSEGEDRDLIIEVQVRGVCVCVCGGCVWGGWGGEYKNFN